MRTLAYSIKQRMAAGGGLSAREASRRKARLQRKTRAWGFASLIGVGILASGWLVGQTDAVSHAQVAVESGLRHVIGGGGYVHLAVAGVDNPKYRKFIKPAKRPPHTARRVLRRLSRPTPAETPPEVLNLIAPLEDLPAIEIPVLDIANLPPPPPLVPLPPTLAPPPTPPPAVPEPQTWIMLTVGLAIVGRQLRRRGGRGGRQLA